MAPNSISVSRDNSRQIAMLEAIARYRGRSGLAEVAVDDTNVLGRPAGSNPAVTQRILTLRTLAVLGDLTQRH